jgi:AraC-like DNA-binding protein
MAVPAPCLDRFPIVRTQNADEMCAALERIYAKPVLHLAAQAKKVDVAINYYPLNFIGLGNTKYGIGVSLEYPDNELVMQTFPIRGRGEAVVDASVSPLDPCHSVTVSPHMRFAARLDADYETLLLVIKPQILADKIEAITGRPLGQPLKFYPTQDDSLPAAKTLRDHFLFLVEMVNASSAPLPRLLLEEYEETLAVMFLHAHRHNHSDLLEQTTPKLAPWQLARAEGYIESHAERAITVDELAAVTGVGVLALSQAFKRTRGVSPAEFVCEVRLRRARDRLQNPCAATTVAAIALASGYADVERFESDYARIFGEEPERTLARSKGPGSSMH